MDHSDHTLLQAGSQTAISDRMRELLARAAQDHVYEQRTQGAVLDEIRQRLEGMEWLLREVRERELGGLNGTLESVNGRLDDISARPPAWAEGLAQHVEAVRDHVDAVGERVQSVGEGVESVRRRVVPLAELPSLWADVGAVGENVEETLVRLGTIVDDARGTGDLVGDVARRLGHIQTSMEAAAVRFTRLDKALGELSQRAARLEAGMPELTASLRGIDERLAALDERASATGVRVASVDARLGEVAVRHEGRFDTLDERLDDVEGRVTGRIEVVDSRLRALDGRAERASERLENVDERVTAVAEHLGGVDEHVTAVAEHLGGVDERVAEVAEHLGGVDERVTAVAERLGRLAAVMDIGDAHRNIDTLLTAQADDQAKRFDSLDDRLAQARSSLVPLADMLRAQPDREQLAEALTRIMEPARADLTRRLGALEETMLALAEALLRPTRNDKD
ncbi:hypothetical protein [Streptosporangium carneum]|uniref:t-SNARE coiled-coil homology domain-containing protein n=1 Tax=Streptosporangium carneum TaxID=47481 RepID=A0A9W6I4D0_9ACTN|nr:hypothetical protein [Streptosporangium carneum]GLK11852.1 hypothetical protein GCM10017600_52600 [Streptosporangium carneum]